MAKICAKCILTDSMPGVIINEDGLCNICQYHLDKSVRNKKQSDSNIQYVLKVNQKKYMYDCLCLYSGGKDSTYMLHNLVKKYHLRVLAFTLDNGFIAKETFSNINKVVSKLQIDNIIYKPPRPLILSVFKTGIFNFDKTLSTKELSFLIGHVCWPCFVMIGIFSLKIAIEKNIPNIVIGATPGQLRQKQYNLISKYNGVFDVYMTMDVPFLKIIDKSYKKKLKLSLLEKIKALKIKLVPFYEYAPYSETEIYETVKTIFDWHKPPDTDSCSTNCLINTLGIAIHKKRYGIHPYVIPLAHDVRSGLIAREDALKAVNSNVDLNIASKIAKKLGIETEQLI